MTPAEFKSRYIESLPAVPEELRDELGLERFVSFDPDAIAAHELHPTDAAILNAVGLPKSASPYLTFDLDPERQLSPIDGFPQMLAIGSNAYGDSVCLDMDAGGAVVYINHDNLNARVLINSSVSTLAESLCLYLAHRHAGDPQDLLSAIGATDPSAVAVGTFWQRECASLAEGNG